MRKPKPKRDELDILRARIERCEARLRRQATALRGLTADNTLYKENLTDLVNDSHHTLLERLERLEVAFRSEQMARAANYASNAYQDSSDDPEPFI